MPEWIPLLVDAIVMMHGCSEGVCGEEKIDIDEYEPCFFFLIG